MSAPMATPPFPIPRELQKERVNIDLVGCGGTGSRILTELAELHFALLAARHPHGLHVTVWDPDVVTEANIGRTGFIPADVGRHKAPVLVTRVNCSYGLAWRGLPLAYDYDAVLSIRPHLVITCVDSLAARASIYTQMEASRYRPPLLWLDCGNDVATGQVYAGEVEWALDPDRYRPSRQGRTRLPHVFDVFPDQLGAAATEVPEEGSCSLLAALGRQSLFINRWVATVAAEILYRLFLEGGLTWHGAFIDAAKGRVRPVLVDPQADAREQRLESLLAGGVPLAPTAGASELAEVR